MPEKRITAEQKRVVLERGRFSDLLERVLDKKSVRCYMYITNKE